MGLLAVALLGLLVTRPSIRAKDASDWLNLLIVPGVLTVIGLMARQYFWTRHQQQMKQDREIACDRERQDVLIDYFDQITLLLLDPDWPGSLLSKQVQRQTISSEQLEASKRLVAVVRARTLVTLQELDGERKGAVIRFLQESRAMPVVTLGHANLSEAKLSGANLKAINLQRANLAQADLSNADLRKTNLKGANLEAVNLAGADLRQADLRETNLKNADFRRAKLEGTLLNRAYVKGANFEGAYTEGAILKEFP